MPNIRPASEREDLEPARAAIHDLFMDHVMSQAPGYEGLRPWVDAPILPTPAAFAKILGLASRELDARILAIDIGGATTDVFTAERGKVFRTVSANLGMSYSILNVAQRAGTEAILELLGNGRASFTPLDLWDEIGEKYLHPTRLPLNARQHEMERAVGTVAIREAVADHLQVLAGVSLNRGKEELHVSRARPRPGGAKGPERRFALSGYDLVIGSGGLLSHSPRSLAARMLIDALRPRKPLEIAVDSAFMFPHTWERSRTSRPSSRCGSFASWVSFGSARMRPASPRRLRRWREPCPGSRPRRRARCRRRPGATAQHRPRRRSRRRAKMRLRSIHHRRRSPNARRCGSSASSRFRVRFSSNGVRMSGPRR